MIRPTNRAIAVFAGAFFPAVILILLDPGYWILCLLLTSVLFGLLLADALAAVRPSQVSYRLRAPEALSIGESSQLDVDFKVGSDRSGIVLEFICDTGDIIQETLRTSIVLKPDRVTTVALALTPLRRGKAHVSRIWMRWPGPWGLMQWTIARPCELTIPVVPNINAVRAAAIEFSMNDAIFGVKPDRALGEGTEYDALREHAQGMDARAIDWKRSAHHRKLMSKEFRTERNHQIIMAFDTGQLMSEPVENIPKLDHAINAGLILSLLSLRSGDRIGLYGFDSRVRHFTKPVTGTRGIAYLQRASADLDYHAEETNFTLGLSSLSARINRRSLVILFTEFIDTITTELMVDNIARLSARHIVIFVVFRDPDLIRALDAPPDGTTQVARSVIASDLLKERAVVLEKLHRLGVLCIEATPETLRARLINAYLAVKSRGMI